MICGSAKVSALAVAGLGVMLALAPGVANAAGSGAAPPADPARVGPVTLCDRQGQQITTGSVSAEPTVWRAVDVTPAPKGYAKNGTATLFAFQPRPGVPAVEWSGGQLTASARYSVAAHPMAAATPTDVSLGNYLQDYPLTTAARLVELRIYLGAPNSPALSTSYDASYLHVANGTWTQLDPGPNDCSAAGKAVSMETLTLPPKYFKTKPGSSPGGSGSATSRSGSSNPSSTNASKTDPVNGTPAAAVSATDRSGTSETGRNIAIAIVVVVLASLAAAYGLRRRS